MTGYPGRALQPLQVTRHIHHFILRHGIVVRCVQPVTPFIGVGRNGLGELHESALHLRHGKLHPGNPLLVPGFPDHGLAPRRQNPQDLPAGIGQRCLDHNQVNEVVHVGKVAAVIEPRRNGTMDSGGFDALARLFNSCRIRIEPLNQRASAGMEGDQSVGIVAAQNHD